MFQGIYTAIITPFRDGKVDEKKLEELVTFQVKAGVQGIVTCGTTGEALFLSGDEQKHIIGICARVCKDKAQVVAGISALSAQEAITLTHQAQRAGADGVLIVTPWYVRPSQESLYQYYKNISEDIDLPIIIYNNPSRTGVDISFETIVRLASFKNIRGYKNSAPSLQRISELRCALGERLDLLAGNDDPFAAHLAMGGDGGIMMASNLAPDFFVTLMATWREGELPLFNTTWKKVFPLLSALALESNPAPIKYAMTLVHGVSAETRLPFAPLSASTQKAIESALTDLGLWKPLASVRER